MSDNTTLIDNLNSIKNSKADIKQALIDKGQQATDVLATYAGLIEDIETGIDTSDATATASDIKEGKTAYVDGEKITGIYVDEDLTDVLDAQDQKIVELEEALENKTAGEARPNIFVQENEPSTKKGIWIKSNDYEIEHIIVDNNVVESETWNTTKMFSLRAIPYNFCQGSSASVGTNIYLFGGEKSKQYAYKYDTLTDTYTQMANIPYNFCRGSSASVGTDIYLFGGTGSTSTYKYNYKYDTLTDTYTKMVNLPYNFYDGVAVTIGTDIYLFGLSAGVNTGVYKYDTLTNSYTQLQKLPFQSYHSAGASVGTDIYLFGGTSSYVYTYKYNTLTNTYTRLTDIPFDFAYGSVETVNTNIYLLGSAQSYTACYKYDTLTNTYTQLTDTLYSFYCGAAIKMGNEIYLFGGSDNPTKVQIMELNLADYENNSFVISQEENIYSTELLNNDNNIKSSFKDVWFYTIQEGLITNLPTYYGDGTQWVKFKN